ncbi:MAG: peroxidase family protein, partial [Planctomycetales bacterium]|nr:peroxidase family protein [Planctomycetales bacterium]
MYSVTASRLVVVAMLSVFAGVVSPYARSEVRTFDGSGNNLSQPWGMAGTPFSRLDSQAHYADGVSLPGGIDRPNPRSISQGVGKQYVPMFDEGCRSDYVWMWGQFIDHDITLRRGGTEPMPILVSEPDLMSPVIPFFRSAAAPGTGTGTDNPRQQINDTTSFVDGSMIYGPSQSRADALRTFSGGMLATSNNGLLLPKNTGMLPNDNEGALPADAMFLAGDVRANENIGLTAMHTLFVREHNYWAGQLAALNPTWDDEQLYQTARKIVSAEVQVVTYSEYLPMLLGDRAPDLATAAYDETVDPSIANEFAAAAYRLGHTQVSPILMRMEADRTMVPEGHMPLSDAFFHPNYLQTGADVDHLLMGATMQVMQQTDARVISTLRNSLFGQPGAGGLDLLSINLQRGRDHGLPSYNEMRAVMGLDTASSFADITSDTEVQAALASVYNSVDDVDLWIGGMAEDHIANGIVGELVSAIVADQFQRLMAGDRMFFLWDNQLQSDQTLYNAILDTRLSDIINRNTDGMHVQQN